MSGEPPGKDTVETPFYIKSNIYYMEVLCINGSEGILEDGQLYTVREITKAGNFLLEGVQVPEGYTSFSANRFAPVEVYDDWDEELEKQYWASQVPDELNA